MKRISISDANFEQLAANDTRARPLWRLASVSYDRRRNRIVMGLANGAELSMPVSLVGELSAATADGLAQIHLSPSGEMVVVDQVDAHIGTRGLIEIAHRADAVTTEAFARIHRTRERFSIDAVTAALIKARTEKAK